MRATNPPWSDHRSAANLLVSLQIVQALENGSIKLVGGHDLPCRIAPAFASRQVRRHPGKSFFCVGAALVGCRHDAEWDVTRSLGQRLAEIAEGALPSSPPFSFAGSTFVSPGSDEEILLAREIINVRSWYMSMFVVFRRRQNLVRIW
jgi:hypothetical protein